MTARKERISEQPPHASTRTGPGHTGRLGLLPTVAACGLAVAACGAGTLWRSAEVPLGPPTRHIVSSARLRTIMRDLQTLRVDRLPQEIDASALLDRRLDALAEAGDELAATAVDIAGAVGTLELDAGDQRRFLGSAGALNRRALVLRSRALEGDLPQAVAAYDDLTVTCDTCHALYRRR